MRLRYIVLILFLFSPGIFAASDSANPPAGADQNISVSQGADKSKITIGDNLVYGLTVTMPQGLSLQKPADTAELGAWEVRESSFSALKTGQNQFELKYTLTTFSTGTIKIPEITLTYTAADKTGQLNTKPLDIEVESVLDKLGNSGDIRDIKPPLGLRPSIWEYLKWLLLLGLLSVAGYFLYDKYLKKRVAVAFQNPEPEIPPEVTALDALEKLKNSTLIAEGRIKEFYIQLSEIVRTFLGKTYKIDTLDRTTGEIYSQLKAAESDKKALALMKDFLEECDLVKFAKYTPEENEIWQDFDTAKKIVTTAQGSWLRAEQG
jgi:hypothetical protein